MRSDGAHRVPVMRPRLPGLAAVVPRLAAVEASGWYSNHGPQEQELRARFAHRFGVDADRVATVANATLGIAGAVVTLGGQRWSLPTFTFPATVAAVLSAGAQPVLCDIDTDTWALDPEVVATDGSVPVAPFGAPPDIARWAGAGAVVHDAAASLGATGDLRDLPAGQAVVFSLHATKVLGAGEGGIVVFGDAADTERFRAWTNFGFAGSRESQLVGVNAKMSEVQACYAHAALDGWDAEHAEWVAARQRIVQVCDAVGIELFGPSREGINPYAIAVFADAGHADRVERLLGDDDVETRRWWAMGCHRMPAFRHLAVRPFPRAERVAATSLGLPMFRGLDETDADRVASALGRILRPVRA